MSPEIFPVTPLVSDAEVVPSSDSGSPMELSIEVTEVSVVAVGVALELPSGVPSVGAAVSTPVISLPEWSGSTHPVVTVAAKPVSSPLFSPFTQADAVPVTLPSPDQAASASHPHLSLSPLSRPSAAPLSLSPAEDLGGEPYRSSLSLSLTVVPISRLESL
ncbi:uncharacterized protein LOC132182642, partial [Corylus avellana]|uniref:uncharacterized protein LOC132182642 n=1 Tax=Corylus avellana TaxID=13451 RepID=UPI00286B846D